MSVASSSTGHEDDYPTLTWNERDRAVFLAEMALRHADKLKCGVWLNQQPASHALRTLWREPRGLGDHSDHASGRDAYQQFALAAR